MDDCNYPSVQLAQIEERLKAVGFVPEEDTAVACIERLVNEVVALRDDRLSLLARLKDLYDRDACLRNLKEGEPFFVLTGHDPITPSAIAFWVREAIRFGSPLYKTKCALEKALRIEAWQAVNFTKVPD